MLVNEQLLQRARSHVVQAPLGDVTVAFTKVSGASTLLAWNRELAQEALQLFQVRHIPIACAIHEMVCLCRAKIGPSQLGC